MSKEKVSEKMVIRFITGITKLEPIEFIGLTKVLCTPIVDEENNPREFDDILSDMIDRFVATGRRQRKDIIKIIEQTGKIKL